ncbi:MAG: ATP-binding protein [Euryarchaeota archaeon]|nr:ATP-binding protein [Euryarchaeota archaeon]
MIRKFIDREAEQDILYREWNSDGGRLIIIYGRRRIGKTRLISEFIKEKSGVMFFAEEVPVRLQIEGFKAEVAGYLKDDLLLSLTIKSWSEFFTYLLKNPPEKRSYLIIDEFSYLIKSDKSILSAIQKAWDRGLSDSPWCIILSGSLLSLMSEYALSYTSPLYGRRTRDMLLSPLTFKDAKLFLQQPLKDSLKTYFTVGGVPEYLQKASDYKTFEKFVSEEFFSNFGYFYREPYFLLSQEFRELKTYQGILSAIAGGKTRPSEIAVNCGIETRKIYPYLEGLIMLGFIEKERSILSKQKNSVYVIKDTLIDFWYNFVHPNKGEIETGQYFNFDFNKYFGKKYEYFIRKEIAPLIFPGSQIGRWWHKEEEIDLIAVNHDTRTVVFGECKYGTKSATECLKILGRLEKKSELVKINDDYRKKYALFTGEIKDKNKISNTDYLIYGLEDLLVYLR